MPFAFPKGRVITKVQIPIVRICNKRCPHCCAREELTWFNKSISEKEIPLSELKQIGDTLGPIEKIEITGGEATLHSGFAELATNLKSYFQCDDVMLVTNGALFKRDPSKLNLLLNFRRVYSTHYTEQFVRNYGGTTNTYEHNLIADFLKSHPQVEWVPNPMDTHVKYGNPPYPGKPCHLYRESDMISCYEGKLYGCCISWSLADRGKGIPLTKDWRDHLTEIALPCENCFMSTAVPFDNCYTSLPRG